MAGNIRLAANGKVNRMRDFIREFLQNPLATVPDVLAAGISPGSPLKPLEGQLPGKQAAIDTAKYNLDNCRVVAPFDARVTNLTISQGAYATAGQHIFTLIDNRTWWVVANFRETQLHNIRPGMLADVYVMSRPNVRYKGIVESVGFGVTPDSDLVGRLSAPGLPDVQRTLNWVHLASRFPVRIRIQDSPPDVFRLGESAVVIVREHAPRAEKE